MAKNKKKNKEGSLKTSVHNIWLAGLGAVAAAEEGGSRLFDVLVAKGMEFEEGPITKAKDKVKKTVKQVRARAGQTLQDVESSIDDRIASVLERRGVPTIAALAKLEARVERLAEAIEGKPPAKQKKKVAKKTVKKVKESGVLH